MIKGHDAFWLAEVLLDTYTQDKGFDSFKCWNIIKTHQVKGEKKPKQKELWK